MRPLALLLFCARLAYAGALDDAKTADHYRDYARELSLLQAEVARGNPEAMRLLGDLYDNGYGVPEDKKAAFRLYGRAEAEGDAIAAYDVANFYEWGDGVEQSTATAAVLKPKAFQLLRACADKGDLKCLGAVANSLLYGIGVEKDPGESAVLSEKLIARYVAQARSGDAYDQYMAGVMYEVATRPVQDYSAARDWFKRSADQGYSRAMSALAGLMENGWGGPKDAEGARTLYQKAVEGDPCAYSTMASPYHFGKDGVARDYAKAAGLYKKGAEAGCAYAAYWLAKMHAEGGYGLEKDLAEAAKWYYRVAKAGHPDAQYELSQAYLKGEGVSQDKAESYKWLLLAYGQSGSQFADSLAEQNESLTAQERAEGRKRAQAFQFVAYPLGKPIAHKQGKAEVAGVAPPAEEQPAAAPVRLPERPKDYAVVVGVEHYRGLPAADYAESDASAVRDRLVDLGFPQRNVITLLDEDATRSKLQAYLEEWLPKNVGKDSNVFFYFSGHGSPDAKSGESFLVPADGDPAFLKSTAYPLKGLYASLEALPAKQVIVALDSCFSGAGGRSVLAKGVRPLVSKIDVGAQAGPGGRLIVLAAAAGDQMTGGLDERRHGAFTYYLLEALSGAARDGAGAITATSLEEYVKPKVADAARRQNRDQTPVLYGDPTAVLFRLK